MSTNIYLYKKQCNDEIYNTTHHCESKNENKCGTDKKRKNSRRFALIFAQP